MIVSKEPMKDAERLLRHFMTKAYRRPIEESEFQRCLSFAKAGIEKKLCFQDAMRTAYKAALCSPDFLFLLERPGELDGYALGARLSYFLWRSIPDAELLKLASSGELKRPSVLKQQVERMLKDARSQRFVKDFTRQWLDLGKIHDTAPDRHLYPEYFCDNHLTESAVLETQAYFREMIEKNLGSRTVFDSDFAMLNERLAKLYGIDGVEGCRIRRVELPKDSTRGGVLTQASVMKVTANGLTTSPVLRGVWLLDRLLGQPVPPPPPNAGAIEPDTRGATTVREQLDKHRRIPSCASCHVKIDPPGFALESFDVMGAERDFYRSFDKGKPLTKKVADRPVRYKRGPKVDASGKTVHGQSFENIQDFRKLLLRDVETPARSLAKRLLTFATGAGIGYADRKTINEILEQTKQTQYGLKSMIHAVVQSRTFQIK